MRIPALVSARVSSSPYLLETAMSAITPVRNSTRVAFRKAWFAIALMFVGPGFVCGHGPNDSVTDQWLAMERVFKGAVDQGFRRLLPHVLKMSEDNDLSAQCTSAFIAVLRKLRSLDRNVLRMVDASGKLAPGLLEGSLTDFGNFDECLSVAVGDDPSAHPLFRGQYCMVKARPPLPPKPWVVSKHFQAVNFSLFPETSVIRELLEDAGTFYATTTRTGLCMPSSCSKQDVESIVKGVFHTMHWSAVVSYCTINEKPHFTTQDIVIVCILSCLSLPVVLSTLLQTSIFIWDAFSKCPPKHGSAIQRLSSLSAYETARKLLVVRAPKDEDSRRLQVFHGLRALSIIWVVWVHHYAYNDISVYSGAKMAKKLVVQYNTQLFNNGWLAVDTFFFVSRIRGRKMRIPALVSARVSSSPYLLETAMSAITPVRNSTRVAFRKAWFAIALMFVGPGFVCGHGPNDSVTDQWLAMERVFKGAVDQGFRRLLPHVLKMSEDNDLSAQCTSAFIAVLRKLRSLDRNVLRMVDASGKLAPGLLEGSLTDFGNFDECLSVAVGDDPSAHPLFRGQYCMVKARPPLPPKPWVVSKHFQAVNFSLFPETSVIRELLEDAGTFYATTTRTGLCMPSSCSKQDVESIVKGVFHTMHWSAVVSYCTINEKPHFTTQDIVIVCILSCLSLPVVLSTLLQTSIFIWDAFSKCPPKHGSAIQRLSSLSAYETARKLLVVRAPKDEDSRRLQVFHGLRALSIIWVVWVHHYAYNDISVYSGAKMAKKLVVQYNTQLFNNGWLAVDTFFFVR
ncbi:nose resistant to fluoxetine protein 6 [Ixodes scapularis]